MDNKPVYLLTYDHGGYILWGPHFVDCMKSAEQWLEKYPKFKIGLDNEAFCYDRYAQENPEILAYVRDILKRFPGRFAIGSASYGQPLSVFINEESNVRQLVYAIRADEKHFGTRPGVYMMSEHAMHNQIPQLVKLCGYDMAIMRTHFMMYGFNPTYDSPVGLWYGEDGTAIPCIPTYEGEGARFGVTTMDNWILTRWPDQSKDSLEDFRDRFAHISPLLASRCDDVVLRREALVEHAEHDETYRWVTLEDLLNIYPQPTDEYRPTSDEFIVRMPWGYCGNKIFNDCRQAEVLLAQAERANALAAMLGMTVQEDALERAWKNLLIAQHHDIQICGLLDDEAEYIPAALTEGKAQLDLAMRHIAGQFAVKGEHALVVFNPNAHTDRQTVVVDVHQRMSKEETGWEAVCGDEVIPCGFDVTEKHNGMPVRFHARFEAQVEGMNAKVYTLRPCASECRQFAVYHDGVLTTERYVLQTGSGGIVSLSDRSGTVFIRNDAPGALLRGIINGHDERSTGEWFVQCKHDCAVARYQGQIGGILCRVTLTFGNMERIDCRVNLFHNGEDIGCDRSITAFEQSTNGFVHEEKLRFIMTVPMSEDVQAIRDLPFTIAATEHKYVQGNYWAAAGDGNIGMAVFNGGSMCLTREEDALSVPLAYANRYAWGEKCLWGEYTHAFALLPFRGGLEPTRLHALALNYTYPFVTYTIGAPQDGPYRDIAAPLNISVSGDIALSSCHIENGSVCLRVYEYGGKEATLGLHGSAVGQAVAVDLLGNELARECAQSIALGSRQILTLRLS